MIMIIIIENDNNIENNSDNDDDINDNDNENDKNDDNYNNDNNDDNKLPMDSPHNGPIMRSFDVTFFSLKTTIEFPVI